MKISEEFVFFFFQKNINKYKLEMVITCKKQKIKNI